MHPQHYAFLVGEASSTPSSRGSPNAESPTSPTRTSGRPARSTATTVAGAPTGWLPTDTCWRRSPAVRRLTTYHLGVPVTYAAFGAMAVTVDGVHHPLTRGRDRGVLAVLLAAHGVPVPADRLVAEVWGADAPPTALGLLQVSVSRLRSILEPDRASRAGIRLVSTGAGYAVRAGQDEVDTWAFEDAAAAVGAAGSPADVVIQAEEAERWWTGDPYAGCTAPAVVAEADRLRELRLVVQESYARALVDTGRPSEAALLLAPLATTQPYREGLWCLLALAQYRSARQAEALATLRNLRTRLVEDLGVDPSEQAQSLERAVLAQDVAIAAPPPAPRRRGRTPPLCRRSATPGRARFTASAVALLDDACAAGEVRYLLVSGEAGIGKTRLVGDLAAFAAGTGFAVLVGRCHEGDYAPALWPWVTIVRGLPGADDAPELAPLLAGSSTADLWGGSGLRMFDAVVALLADSAGDSPCCSCWRTSTGPTRRRSSCYATWRRAHRLRRCRVHPAYGRGPPPSTTWSTRWPPWPAPAPNASGSTAWTPGRSPPCSGPVGAHDPQLDGSGRARDRRQPVLRAAVRPLAAGSARPRGRRCRRAADARGRPRRAAPADPPADGGDRATPDRGSRPGHRHRPRPGRRARRRAGDRPARPARPRHHERARRGTRHRLRVRARPRARDDVRRAERRPQDAPARRAGRVIESTIADDPDASAAIAYHAHLAAPLGRRAGRPRRAMAGPRRLARRARHAHAEALDAVATGPGRRAARTAPRRTTPLREGGGAAPPGPDGRGARGRSSARPGSATGSAAPTWSPRAAAILNGAGVWSWREHGRRDDEFVTLLDRRGDRSRDAPKPGCWRPFRWSCSTHWTARRRSSRRTFGRAGPRCRRRRRAPRGAAGQGPVALGSWLGAGAPGAPGGAAGALARRRGTRSRDVPLGPRCSTAAVLRSPTRRCASARPRRPPPAHRRGDPAGLVALARARDRDDPNSAS